jgi:hypothetical protein
MKFERARLKKKVWEEWAHMMHFWRGQKSMGHICAILGRMKHKEED